MRKNTELVRRECGVFYAVGSLLFPGVKVFPARGNFHVNRLAGNITN